jgi:uncharacterized protein (TIGR03089 family)
VTPEQLFADLLAANPSQPFVTYYDEATGERAELSVKSLANWVAKTHHLLATELGLGRGNTASVALPAHWLSVPVVLGVFTAGLQIVEDETSDVAFVVPSTLIRAAGAFDVYALNPAAPAVGFGASGDAPPPGTNDYVASVRPQADAWGSVQFGAGSGDPGLATRSRADVVAWATQRAAALGLSAGARVLTDRDWLSANDLVDTLLAPLAVGGSVVYVRNASPEILSRRADQERATKLI